MATSAVIHAAAVISNKCFNASLVFPHIFHFDQKQMILGVRPSVRPRPRACGVSENIIFWLMKEEFRR